MPQFLMTFNKRNLNINHNNLARNTNINKGLNMPMIERVHKSKPGCSACGKKVM